MQSDKNITVNNIVTNTITKTDNNLISNKLENPSPDHIKKTLLSPNNNLTLSSSNNNLT